MFCVAEVDCVWSWVQFHVECGTGEQKDDDILAASLQLREIEKQQAADSATMIKFMVFECSQVDTLSQFFDCHKSYLSLFDSHWTQTLCFYD